MAKIESGSCPPGLFFTRLVPSCWSPSPSLSNLAPLTTRARFERDGEGDQQEGTSLVKNSPGGYEPLSIFAVDLLLLNYRLEGLCDMTFVT